MSINFLLQGVSANYLGANVYALPNELMYLYQNGPICARVGAHTSTFVKKKPTLEHIW